MQVQKHSFGIRGISYQVRALKSTSELIYRQKVYYAKNIIQISGCSVKSLNNVSLLIIR